MADIKIGANVQCSDAQCGKAKNVILNPVTKKVTHIVVEDKKLPEHSTRLVPISKIQESSPTQIILNCNLHDLTLMSPFVDTQYVQAPAADKVYPPSSYYYFPYEYFDYPRYYLVKEENIPEGELSLVSGMEIDASDGKIGKLDELVIDPESGVITHFLMKEGHLWGEKVVTIPVSAASSAVGGVVHLKIDKKAIEALPTVPLKPKIPGRKS